MILSWTRVVDVVTIIWLAIFIFGFFVSPALADTLRMVNIAILSVFVADLWVSYRKVRSVSVFAKKHWLDILMVIPYFRIFRVARILRLIRFARIVRGAKVARLGKGALIVHEIGDLLRAVKSRFVR